MGYLSEGGNGDSSSDTRSRTLSFGETEPITAIDVAMAEFRLNGVDSPYEPDEDFLLYPTTSAASMGKDAPGSRDRRRSWAAPAPAAGPAASAHADAAFYRRSYSYPGASGATQYTAPPQQAQENELPMPSWLWDITEQQLRILRSLPDSVISYLLELGQRQHFNTNNVPAFQSRRARSDEVIECRFCKNNGEQESFCRSHRLRYEGRVECPVLRAYRCKRCGATGDYAHTLKYCPLATAAERSRSRAMMLSLRNRRNYQAPSIDTSRDYVRMGEAPYTVINDSSAYARHQPLEPTWEALANQLML